MTLLIGRYSVFYDWQGSRLDFERSGQTPGIRSTRKHRHWRLGRLETVLSKESVLRLRWPVSASGLVSLELSLLLRAYHPHEQEEAPMRIGRNQTWFGDCLPTLPPTGMATVDCEIPFLDL